MSTSFQQQQQEQASLNIWALRWRERAGAKGRKHVAIFITDLQSSDVDPTQGTAPCTGTLYQVVGSPYTGFMCEIARNWDSTQDTRLEDKIYVGSIDQKHIWAPTTPDPVNADNINHCAVDSCASITRPPSVTKRLWVAEEVMDCQDWVVSFLECLVQRRIIAREALSEVQQILGAKVGLMREPSGHSSQVDTQQGSVTSVNSMAITNSTIQMPARLTRPDESSKLITHIRQDPVQTVSGNAARFGNSKWSVERARFERYNHQAGIQEYRDGSQWVAWT